jgi:hypothetical protein
MSDEGAEPRSDAPKSIAASLMVPADMLAAALPSDGHHNRHDERRGTERSPHPGSDAPDEASFDDALHQNPFLIPEAVHAARGSDGARPARRRVTPALLMLWVGAIDALRSGARQGLVGVHRQRRRGVRRTAVMLAFAAAAIALTAAIRTQSDPMHSSAAQAGRTGGSASTANPLESGPFAAQVNPSRHRLSTRKHAVNRPRRTRAHRLSDRHTKARPASRTPTVPARYTPRESTAGSPPPASATRSYASSGSTSAPVQPAASAGGSVTPSGGSGSTDNRPAFGENGILGPGHSPDS